MAGISSPDPELTPARPPTPERLGAKGEAREEQGRGGSRHLQLTLQSTVQSQRQKQQQRKVHSLLTITGGPLGASGRRASRILATHLSFLSRPALAVGNRSSGGCQMGSAASIFNAASRPAYQSPPSCIPTPASAGGPGDTRCVALHLSPRAMGWRRVGAEPEGNRGPAKGRTPGALFDRPPVLPRLPPGVPAAAPLLPITSAALLPDSCLSRSSPTSSKAHRKWILHPAHKHASLPMPWDPNCRHTRGRSGRSFCWELACTSLTGAPGPVGVTWDPGRLPRCSMLRPRNALTAAARVAVR